MQDAPYDIVTGSLVAVLTLTLLGHLGLLVHGQWDIRVSGQFRSSCADS
ncbi:hypothetical protein [Streptomyces sp. A5-4]